MKLGIVFEYDVKDAADLHNRQAEYGNNPGFCR